MKRKYIDYLTKKDIERVLKDCGYRLLTVEECEQQFGDKPYKKQQGVIACYCVISPYDMRDLLERQFEEKHPELGLINKSRRLSELMAFMLAMSAQMGDKFLFPTVKKSERTDREFDTTYVRKVVFDDYFVKEIKKKKNKQNLFEKAINQVFNDHMSFKFPAYAKQREKHYEQLFSGELKNTL